MTLVEMRTVKITSKGQISLPQELREKTFKEGSKVAVLAYEDRIEIRPMNIIDEKMELMLASRQVLGREWDTPEEEEAWKDL